MGADVALLMAADSVDKDSVLDTVATVPDTVATVPDTEAFRVADEVAVLSFMPSIRLLTSSSVKLF